MPLNQCFCFQVFELKFGEGLRRPPRLFWSGRKPGRMVLSLLAAGPSVECTTIEEVCDLPIILQRRRILEHEERRQSRECPGESWGGGEGQREGCSMQRKVWQGEALGRQSPPSDRIRRRRIPRPSVGADFSKGRLGALAAENLHGVFWAVEHQPRGVGRSPPLDFVAAACCAEAVVAVLLTAVA